VHPQHPIAGRPPVRPPAIRPPISTGPVRIGNTINVGSINVHHPWTRPVAPPYYRSPYWGYHHRHGHYGCWYWGPNWRAPWSAGNFALGFVTGAAGALIFRNPYASSGSSNTTVHNYSQPLVTPQAAGGQAPPDSATLTEASAQHYDAARATFKQGRYEEALTQVDQAIAGTPKDPVLHEFRALCLFALKRYDEAAQVLYTVLAAGPGWDWQTMSAFYPNPEAYTHQLHLLENAVKANPKSAPDAFVLAYQYMCLGDLQASASMFKVVTELQPEDTVSAALLKSVTAAS
jgi:hypothetical protein